MTSTSKVQRLARLRQESAALSAEIENERKREAGELNAQFLVLLRQAMRERELTQKALADALGIVPVTVCKILHAHHSPTLKTVERLLKAAGYKLTIHLEDAEHCRAKAA